MMLARTAAQQYATSDRFASLYSARGGEADRLQLLLGARLTPAVSSLRL